MVVTKRQILFMFFLIDCILFMGLISSVPQLTINSPENVTYDSTKIIVNATSNELVDFFIRDAKTGRRIILAENTNSFDNYLYVKNGSYGYTLWANNSNGETNASVVFESSIHNPINITSCGTLYSSDAKYDIVNDLIPSSSTRDCLSVWNLRNVSVNLNDHIVNSGTRHAVILFYSSDIELFNGTLNSTHIITSSYPILVEAEGTKLKFSDLFLDGHIGFSIWTLDNVIFENITVNSSLGFWYYAVTNTYFINSSFIWDGHLCSPIQEGVGFYDQSDHSSIFLENVTFEGFPYDFYLTGTFTDFFLRHTYINMSKIYYVNRLSDTRFFTQHLLIVNVTDQFGITGSCSVRVLDNGALPRLEGEDVLLSTLANPTAMVYIPTGETGVGQTWLTEKLVLARTSSPPVITEYDFSNYTLTTRGWGEEEYSETTVNLTGLHSIINVDFKINTSVGEELPSCTISQMLDLNNDGYVNILDATIVLRKITGLPVSVDSTKECEGINLNAF